MKKKHTEKKNELDPNFLYSIVGLEDNWQKFDYNERILDAFANLFHFKAPVTAVHKYQDNLCVSYNTQPEEYMKIQAKLGKYILASGSADNLLTFYLLLNIDFLDFIEGQCRYEWQQLHKISNSTMNFKSFKKKCIEEKSHPTSLLELEDFMSLIKETKAVLQLSISNFCSKKEESFKQVSKIQDKIQKALKVQEFNNTFDEIENDCLLKLFDELKKCSNVVSAYENILFSIKIDKTEFRELLFHPIQDCFKASYFIKQGYKINDIIILDNKDNVHADTNVVDHFPLVKSFDYIGVSRLACGYCHEYLNQKIAFHRGTHGIIDPQWKMNLSSPQEEDFKESISAKAKKLDKGEEPLQHRRLSFDSFEEKIPELWKLKEKLGFIKQDLFIFDELINSNTKQSDFKKEELKDDFDLLDIISNDQELKNVDTVGKTNTFLDECD